MLKDTTQYSEMDWQSGYNELTTQPTASPNGGECFNASNTLIRAWEVKVFHIILSYENDFKIIFKDALKIVQKFISN